jgi:hypothetical protein
MSVASLHQDATHRAVDGSAAPAATPWLWAVGRRRPYPLPSGRLLSVAFFASGAFFTGSRSSTSTGSSVRQKLKSLKRSSVWPGRPDAAYRHHKSGDKATVNTPCCSAGPTTSVGQGYRAGRTAGPCTHAPRRRPAPKDVAGAVTTGGNMASVRADMSVYVVLKVLFTCPTSPCNHRRRPLILKHHR